MTKVPTTETLEALRRAARTPGGHRDLHAAFETEEGREALRLAFDSPEGRQTLLDAFDTPEAKETLKRVFDTPEGREALRGALGTKDRKKAFGESYLRDIEGKQPRFRDAVWEDAKVYSSLMMGPPRFDTRAGFLLELFRLTWTSDAFVGMLLYRVRKLAQAKGVPVLPRLLHRATMALTQICIGDYVVLHPGVYLPHGQVVIDGGVEIGSGTAIAPWVTIGRSKGALDGPHIGAGVFIGTGAKLLGPIKVGMRAAIGANAVVVKDVAPFTTVGGIPAEMITDRRDDPDYEALVDAIRAQGQKPRDPATEATETATGGSAGERLPRGPGGKGG